MTNLPKALTLSLLVACAGRAPPVAAQRTVAACTARSLGAIPDDSIDDRLALQAALAGGCADTLEAGTYDVRAPAWPRPWWSLQMPPDTTLAGIGNATVIRCTGADGGHDWRCIETGDRTRVTRLRLEVRLDATQEEQTHAIRITGPRTGVRIDHVTFHHPVVAGSSMGDCIQVVGGPGAEAVDFTIDHNTFLACARSGVAIHSGVRGFRITNNHFIDDPDQDIDEEGSGGIVDGEIAWNTFDLPQSLQSSLSVSIMSATNQHIHDNTWAGRGLDLYGCNGCELDHNIITQTVPTPEAVMEVRKTSHLVSIHDEVYTRAASAGAGAVVAVLERLGTAPDHVTIRDSALVQHTAGPAMGAAGIIGLTVDRVTMIGDKPYTLAIDLQGTKAITTTDLHITDSTIIGPWTTAVRLTGSYAGGAGTLDMTRVVATGSVRGLMCENVTHSVSASGYVIGGITGPVTYTGNTMPTPSCGGLIASPLLAKH